jgi:hypothetical protein
MSRHEPFFYGENMMATGKCMTLLVACCLLSACSVGVGGVGIGGGSNGVGVGAGLTFPIGGNDLNTSTDSSQSDCRGEVYQVLPNYPAQAAAQAFEGKVTVAFDVKSNGRATGYSAKGDKAFFDETWKAVARSCWTPGVKQHLDVIFTMNKPVMFTTAQD